MKLSLISAFLIFMVPTAWADNNGGPEEQPLDGELDGNSVEHNRYSVNATS